MKTTALKFLCSLSLLTPLVGAAPLDAVAWNLEWFPGGRPNASQQDQAKHLKGAKAELKKIAPDILLAQELSDEKAFEQLAEEAGLAVHVFSKFPDYKDPEKPGRQQCGIASNLTAHSAWFEDFQPVKDLPSLTRGFAFAALEHPKGGLMMLYSVHLKSNRGSGTPQGAKNVAATRAEAVKQLVAHKAAMEQKFTSEKIVGWLIAGDLNTNHDEQFPLCTVVKDLEAAGFYNTWSQTPKSERATWRSFPDVETRRFEPTTFDYAMTIGFKKVQAEMEKEVPRALSDHFPIKIELILEE